MLALLKDKTTIVGQFYEDGWFELPDGSKASPAYDGWENEEGYSLKTIAEGEPVPEGHHLTGRTLQIINGVPTWVNEFEVSPVHFEELTARQFWLSADDIKISKQKIFDKIKATFPEEQADRLILEVDTTTTFIRDYPLIAQLAVLMDISSAQLDELWFRAIAKYQ